MPVKHTINKNRKTHSVITGVAISFIIPLVAWIIDYLANHLPVNGSTFIQMHVNHPSFFLIDFIPLAVFIILFQLSKTHQSNEIYYLDLIKQRDERINKNADFAKRIGEGDYTSVFEPDGTDDTLGNSLLRMRENLIVNNKKESEQSWIAAGKEQISNILRINNKIESLTYETLVALIKYINAVQGAFYIHDEEREVLVNF
jgi:hypothetical protein